jgi:hypothetical protein
LSASRAYPPKSDTTGRTRLASPVEGEASNSRSPSRGCRLILGGEGAGGRSDRLERHRPFSRGTSGSNPSSSTGESVANSISPESGLKPGAVGSCTVTTIRNGTGQIPRRTRWFSGYRSPLAAPGANTCSSVSSVSTEIGGPGFAGSYLKSVTCLLVRAQQVRHLPRLENSALRLDQRIPPISRAVLSSGTSAGCGLVR